MNTAALIAFADCADAFARAARALVDDAPANPDALVSLREAAAIAKTTIGVVRAAIRSRRLTGYGGQRDRSVRRGDLAAWIAERRLPVADGPDDIDIDRRVKRLARIGRRRTA